MGENVTTCTASISLETIRETLRSLPPPDPNPVVRVEVSLDLLDLLRRKAGGQMCGTFLHGVPVRIVDGSNVARVVRKRENDPNA